MASKKTKPLDPIPPPFDVTSVVDKLLRERMAQKDQEKILVDNEMEWARVINLFASTDNGKYFFKILVRICGVFKVDADATPSKMLEDKGAREIYNKWIRPYLDKSLRMDIE